MVVVRRACSRTVAATGKMMAASTAIIAITVSISTIVKALALFRSRIVGHLVPFLSVLTTPPGVLFPYAKRRLVSI
ncbi:hypothetical protein HRbin16_02523 [bacterium HR16]|nr:hypothetical protein HRbin16_02523 [bacterium HR16]